MRELEEKIASLEEARAADAETISRQANNLTTLRESSLVQIRRLSSLERELDAARTSVASTSTERDNLRTKAQKLEEELGAVRSALALAESATRDAQQALEGVVRALAAAPRQEATLALVSDVPRGAIIGDG